MNRATALALAILCALLAGVVAESYRQVRQERTALLEQFATDRVRQVNEVARVIEDDFERIGDDLRFVGQLVLTADTAIAREREISALLAAGKEYHRVGVFDVGGDPLLSVTDPLARSDSHERFFEGALRDAARSALVQLSGELTVTPPIEGDGGAWFRVIASALPVEQAASAHAPGAVAMLVDTNQLFDKLRLVTAERELHLLLLGPHGRATRASDPALAAALEAATVERTPAYVALIQKMRHGEHGLLWLDDHEADRLGLGAADAIATFAPIEVKGRGVNWSVAALTSTSALRAHERMIIVRLVTASALVVLCLIAFVVYLVITSRRAVEIRERLRHANRLAHIRERILDNIPTGVMGLSEEGRIVAVNRALRERTPSSAIGQDLERAFPGAPEASTRLLRSLVDLARSTGQVRSLHGVRLPLFGEEGQYSLHAVPLDPKFDESGILLVIEDQSQVHLLESQLLRAEKLATVGVLAAGIAHEIGTPLGVVRGRAEYALEKLGAAHGQASSIQVIVDQIDRISRTIRQLLDFSRVSPAAVQPIELGPIAARVAQLMHFESERRRVTLTVEIPENLPALSADPDQLQQVLLNLLLNSFDACEGGGHIRLSARFEQPEGILQWSRVRLEVEDDGCGIPIDRQHQAFDPFFTTKKGGEGTGLGLTIASQIVRNHGGEIELDSEPGRGTKVSIFWPVASAESERHHARS